jgi:hypothetical protein
VRHLEGGHQRHLLIRHRRRHHVAIVGVTEEGLVIVGVVEEGLVVVGVTEEGLDGADVYALLFL